jgi:hypothetical protein
MKGEAEAVSEVANEIGIERRVRAETVVEVEDREFDPVARRERKESVEQTD